MPVGFRRRRCVSQSWSLQCSLRKRHKMRQRNQVIRTLGWPRPEKQTIHRCALPVAGLRRPQRAMAAAVRRAGRTGAAAAGRSGLPANGDGGFHLYAGRVPEGRTGEYCENSRRVPTLRAVRAAQKGSKQTTQGDNVVVLAVGEIVPGVEQGLRGLLEGVRNVGTEVGATSPMLAASAVVASGGRLVSAAAATTVVASDLPTSCRWLAKAFEPAAVAAVSSAAGGTGCRPPHRSEPVCGRTKRHCGAVLVRAPRVGGVLRGALVSVTS